MITKPETKQKSKTVSIVDRVEAFFDKVAPLVERMVAAERERDFYKKKLINLQDKLKLMVKDDEAIKPPEYIGLTSAQMDVARVSFPNVPTEKAYQNYSENVLILRSEGKINNRLYDN